MGANQLRRRTAANTKVAGSVPTRNDAGTAPLRSQTHINTVNRPYSYKIKFVFLKLHTIFHYKSLFLIKCPHVNIMMCRGCGIVYIEWKITCVDYQRMSVVLTACNFLFPDSEVLSGGAYCVFLTIVLSVTWNLYRFVYVSA